MIQQITLSGFGDFHENEEDLKDLQETATRHGVEFYPTYYDHELKGNADDIEAVTKDLWGMPREQWEDNNLIEEIIN